jgi:hypothetical protein
MSTNPARHGFPAPAQYLREKGASLFLSPFRGNRFSIVARQFGGSALIT